MRAGVVTARVLKCRIMASRSVNKVLLIGHLGRDAETAYTASQVAVTKFSVATNRRWKDQATGEWKEETDWTRVVLWRGENVAPYLVKGTQVYVEGRLQTRSYDDKDGKKVWATDVVADEVILLGGRGQAGRTARAGLVCKRLFSLSSFSRMVHWSKVAFAIHHNQSLTDLSSFICFWWPGRVRAARERSRRASG